MLGVRENKLGSQVVDKPVFIVYKLHNILSVPVVFLNFHLYCTLNN